MATNAAKELLALIDTWKHEASGKNPTVLTQRGTSTQFGEALWKNELDAVRLLLEIEAFIDTDEDAHEYAEFVDELRNFVFVPEHGWAQAPVKLGASTRLGLVQLGKLMTHSPTRSLSLTPLQIEAIQEALDECEQILDPVTVGQDHGLQHLREVIRYLKQLLDGDDVDFEAVRAASYEAVGLVAIHARDLPEEKRERLATAVWSVIVPFASGTAAGATGNLISAALSGILQISA